MKCRDNEQCSTSNAQRKNKKKQDQSKHGPPQNVDIGSGAMEELAYSSDRSHPPCAFVVLGKTKKSVDNSVINNGPTKSMKNVCQRSA